MMYRCKTYNTKDRERRYCLDDYKNKCLLPSLSLVLARGENLSASLGRPEVHVDTCLGDVYFRRERGYSLPSVTSLQIMFAAGHVLWRWESNCVENILARDKVML